MRPLLDSGEPAERPRRVPVLERDGGVRARHAEPGEISRSRSRSRADAPDLPAPAHLEHREFGVVRHPAGRTIDAPVSGGVPDAAALTVRGTLW